MSWTKDYFTSTIGRKFLMSITGLFLVFFLIEHLAGNLLLLLGDHGLTFNAYSDTMANNPIIRIVEIILFLSLIIHPVQALILTQRNRGARKTGYAVSKAGETSSWASRNMGILGSILFVFLVLHIANFFVSARFGDLGIDANGNKDIYTKVVDSFSMAWYSLFYIFCFLALGFHLIHGILSGFKTLGLSHKKYLPVVKSIGIILTVLFTIGFISIPAYFLINMII